MVGATGGVLHGEELGHGLGMVYGMVVTVLCCLSVVSPVNRLSIYPTGIIIITFSYEVGVGAGDGGGLRRRSGGSEQRRPKADGQQDTNPKLPTNKPTTGKE